MKVYKVIRRQRGFLFSVNAPVDAQLVYHVGTWIRPKEGCGPLVAFKDLEVAISFVEYHFPKRAHGFRGEYWDVYEAEAKPWNQKLPRFKNHVVWLWSPTEFLPIEPGSRIALCREIKLLKKVY